MARIRAFKGYRYASEATDISTFCAPPYDVIGQAQRDAFEAGNPYNSVVLELAPGALDLETPGNRYVNAKASWDAWKAQGIIVPEQQACIYLLEQRYELPGASYARSVFVCETQVRPFADKIILPHELTLPKALGDRYRLISTTHANFSSVFGLFSYGDNEDYQRILQQVKAGEPLSTATDADGVRSTLWGISEPALIQRISDVLANKQIFIADGHHRYTTAVAFRDEMRQARFGTVDCEDLPGFNPEADSEYTLISLANMDDPQLVVLPYHRAVKDAGCFDARAFMDRMSQLFELTPNAQQSDLDACQRPSFLMCVKDVEGMVLAQLKPEVDLDTAISADHSSAWKHVDYAIVQELLLSPIFGIDPKNAESLGRMAYSKKIEELQERVAQGTSDVAFRMRPIKMEQMEAVSTAGETMPQKSTYFYPKLPSGMVYRNMDC